MSPLQIVINSFWLLFMEGGSTSLRLGLFLGEFNEGHPELNAQERNELLKIHMQEASIFLFFPPDTGAD